MKQNVGKFDRIFRLILGVVLIAAPFVSGMALFSSTIATVIALIAGVVMLLTALMSSCPIYSIFGIKTCKV
jgi:hypothetical protein